MSEAPSRARDVAAELFLRAEMAVLESRGSRRSTLFGAAGASPVSALLDLALSGASIELCLRRLVLEVMFRGAPQKAHLAETFGMLLDVFGHQHIATLTALEAAGLVAAKAGGRAGGDTESSCAAMRVLLDKAEANQRSHKDTLALSAIIEPGADAAGAPGSPGGGQSPYGRYRPVSTLLIRSALRKYMPEWAKARHLLSCATNCAAACPLC